MIALSAEGLRKTVTLASGEPLNLLRSVDLAVEPGESVAVVGRSGSGKSTLLALLGLLLRPDGGRLVVAGRDVERLGDRERSAMRNEHVGFVFQNYSLLGHLTAAENVGLPLLQGRKVQAAEARSRVHSALESVDLLDRAESRPRQLSGGEQQRVAIARALVRSPKVILADEPTGAIDTTTAEQVLATLEDVVHRHDAALVLVTHDELVAARADRVLQLEDGVVESELEALCA